MYNLFMLISSVGLKSSSVEFIQTESTQLLDISLLFLDAAVSVALMIGLISVVSNISNGNQNARKSFIQWFIALLVYYGIRSLFF